MINGFFPQTVILFGLSALSAGVVQAETRQAGAHVHGLNQLQIIKQGAAIQALYTMPAEQLEGDHADEHEHEHEHEHSSEHKSHDDELAKAIAEFADASLLFELSGVACVTSDWSYQLSAVSSADGEHAGHKDLQLEYTLECSADVDIRELRIRSFEHFAELEEVELEAIIDGRAISQRVTSSTEQVDL